MTNCVPFEVTAKFTRSATFDDSFTNSIFTPELVDVSGTPATDGAFDEFESSGPQLLIVTGAAEGAPCARHGAGNARAMKTIAATGTRVFKHRLLPFRNRAFLAARSRTKNQAILRKRGYAGVHGNRAPLRVRLARLQHASDTAGVLRESTVQ
jgi:hypothetical protein